MCGDYSRAETIWRNTVGRYLQQGCARLGKLRPPEHRVLFCKIKVRPRSCRSYPLWRPCDLSLKSPEYWPSLHYSIRNTIISLSAELWKTYLTTAFWLVIIGHIWSLESCSGFIDEPLVLLLPDFTPEAVHGFLNYVTQGFHQVCSQLNFLFIVLRK